MYKKLILSSLTETHFSDKITKQLPLFWHWNAHFAIKPLLYDPTWYNTNYKVILVNLSDMLELYNENKYK
jgi:hypothetical protein